MSETCVDDYNDLLQEYGLTQEQKLYDDMLAAQMASQPEETDDQKQLVQKYKDFLVFKVYGKGAFGEVTEFYNILKREKVAKKVFTELRDYLVEKDVMDKLDSALGRELNNELILNVNKYDIENQTIYYRAGNCNIADVSNKMREENLYWFDNEDQLHFINNTMFDYVLRMAEKQVYHSDLKPVNAVLVDKKEVLEGYDFKLIDMGGATYHYSYLVAITITYFPEQDKFDANASEENRTKAEIYQVGRILQELCLSSVHSKQQMLYAKGKYASYKKFIQHYMQNNEKMRQESLELIKIYYSECIYNTVKTFLDYTKGVDACKKIIEQNKPLAAPYFRDRAELIKRIESIQMSKMFSKIDREGEKFINEMNFYMQFDFDQRAFKRIKDVIKRDHRSHNYYEYPLLAVYEAIFAAKIGDPCKSHLFYKGIKYDAKDSVQQIFKDPSITDFLKLQFFVYSIANCHEQLEKDKMNFIIETLGFDSEDCPYEEAIDKYHKFFIKGSSSIYNDALVKKTINEFDKLIKENKDDEEKVRLFKGFKLNIRVLYVTAVYKEIENCIKKKMDVISVIEDGEKLFEDIKGSRYGKEMQFLQLVKGMFLLKKYKIEDKNDKAELEKIREILRECADNMNKVGFPIPEYENQLYAELAILSNELEDFDRVSYYDYIRQRMQSKKNGKIPLVNDSRVKSLNQSGKEEEQFKYKKNLYDEYYQHCYKWFGQNILEKQIFYIERIKIYEDVIRGKKFENSLPKQKEQLQKLSECIKMNDLNTGLANLSEYYNTSYKKDLLPNQVSILMEKIIEAEQKSDKELFSKDLQEDEKKYAVDLFSADFKLHFIKFAVQQGLNDTSVAYSQLDYLKDKYLEDKKIQNEIFLAEIYISILANNSKKLKKAKKELVEENFTPLQQHTQKLLDQFATDFAVPYKPLDQTLYQDSMNEWRCINCEEQLKYFDHSKYEDNINIDLACSHCFRGMGYHEKQYLEPAYGCLCKIYQKQDNQRRYKPKILSDGVELEEYKVDAFKYYMVCLKCYVKPKINICRKCEKPLQRGGDIYKNGGQIGQTSGFHCRIKESRFCQEDSNWRRSHGQNLYCPDCEIDSEFTNDPNDFEMQPYEKKYTVCIPCSNAPVKGSSFNKLMDKYPELKQKYENDLKQVTTTIKEGQDIANARQTIQKQSRYKYKGYDYELCYDLVNNKYGKDWEQYYEQELEYKKNPKKRPKNMTYPVQQKQQQESSIQQPGQQKKQPQQQKDIEIQQQNGKQQSSTQQQQQQKGSNNQQQNQKSQPQPQQKSGITPVTIPPKGTIAYYKYQATLEYEKKKKQAQEEYKKMKQRDQTACCTIF